MNDKEIIDQLRSTVFKLMEENKKYEKVIKIYQAKRIYESVISSTNSCYVYNSLMDYKEDQLKEEEYELLKEVLSSE